MDFFTSQDVARKKTKWLIAIFIMAVIAMIAGVYLVVMLGVNWSAAQGEGDAKFILWNPSIFLLVSVGVIAVIFSGSLYKVMELRSGGSSVASLLGGRRLQPNTGDAAERRMLNVVEEMALAAGAPVPPVYVLDREEGINAFAAGYTMNDAVIGVNRGTIEQLNREELQGVVAHEFSHILNGDMRMSIRMMGILHGILLLALIGYFILRGSVFGGTRRDNKGAGAILFLGLGLVVVGSVGMFFARVIKASVSRQREYLADASAVQFTRNPNGIGGALKMIGAVKEGSRMRASNAEVASHMYFANMFSHQMFRLLSTHPPLVRRIQAIEPNFQGDFSAYLETRSTATVLGEADKEGEPSVTEKEKKKFPFPFGDRLTPDAIESRFPIDPIMVVAAIGLPTQEDVEHSRALVESIPSELSEAARDVYSARCLVFGSLLSRKDRATFESQVKRIRERAGDNALSETNQLLPRLRELDPRFRLPLFEIVQGTLVNMSPEQYGDFRALVQELIDADDKVTLFEFFLQHHLLVHLDRNFGEAAERQAKYKSVYILQEDIMRVVGVVALAGHEREEDATAAFAQAMEELGQATWGRGERLKQVDTSAASLSKSLDRLASAVPKIKKQILQAIAIAIHYDRQVTVQEAELFRGIAEALDCPVPPVIAGKVRSSAGGGPTAASAGS